MRRGLMGNVLLLCLAGPAMAAPDLAVTGKVEHALHLSLADLRAMPPGHVTATQVSGHGPVPLDCTGVPLTALLEKAGLALGAAKNARLAHSVLITADDGYAVALSLGELDPDYGNANALIATDCNGKPEESPRLVVPSDKHGGRAVRGLVSIDVR